MAIEMSPIAGGAGAAGVDSPPVLGGSDDPLVVTPAQVASLPWKAVESSNVRRLALQGVSPLGMGDLWVEFKNGAVYRYQGVSKDKFERLLEANSVGSMMNKTIRNRHPYTQAIIRDGEMTEDTVDIADLKEKLEAAFIRIVALEERVTELESNG
jgi:hypothetical protein